MFPVSLGNIAMLSDWPILASDLAAWIHLSVDPRLASLWCLEDAMIISSFSRSS